MTQTTSRPATPTFAGRTVRPTFADLFAEAARETPALLSSPFVVRIEPYERVSFLLLAREGEVSFVTIYPLLDCDNIAIPHTVPTPSGVAVDIYADEDSLGRIPCVACCSVRLSDEYVDDQNPLVGALLLAAHVATADGITSHAFTAADVPSLRAFSFDGLVAMGQLILPQLCIDGWSRA